MKKSIKIFALITIGVAIGRINKKIHNLESSVEKEFRQLSDYLELKINKHDTVENNAYNRPPSRMDFDS